jgi:hypothetical protein
MVHYVNRPCYCTRDDLRRALDVTLSSSSDDRLDRAIVAAAEACEALTQRKFHMMDTTASFDWPNFQYAYPWNLYLDNWELAATPTLVVTGSLLPSPITIPTSNYILQPVNDGPPFTWLELRRDLNSAFGYNPTPQNDIAITGTFGYWAKTRAAGTATALIGSGDATVSVSDSSLIGVGDTLIADSERMIVYDMKYADTGSGFVSGITTASASDNVGVVSSGAAFDIGEVLLVDFEWMQIQNIVGNNLVVKRGYGGSILATHSGGDIWARRTVNVLRGQLGTTAASHSNGVTLAVAEVPGLIRQLAIAEAEVWLTQETGAYSIQTGGLGSGTSMGIAVGQSGGGEARVSQPGSGISDLRDRVYNSKYTRKMRTRVILCNGCRTFSGWTICPDRTTGSGPVSDLTSRRSP